MARVSWLATETAAFFLVGFMKQKYQKSIVTTLNKDNTTVAVIQKSSLIEKYLHLVSVVVDLKRILGKRS